MPRMRNLILAGTVLVAVGIMALPAEASHRGRGHRGPHPHHRVYRHPHHLYHHHYKHHAPVPHHRYWAPPPYRYHYRGPAVVYPYGPRPGVGVGVWGPRGGFHFRF